MKPLLIVASVLFLTFGLIAAEPNEWQGKKVPQLVLADGKTYTDVTFTDIGASSVAIKHAGGLARIPLEALKPEARQALGYDAVAAAKEKAQQEEARIAEEARVFFAAAAAIPDPGDTIPGIAAVDVHGNLEKLGFQTTRIFNEDEILWTSKSEDRVATFIAEILGNGPTKIKSVRATAIVNDPSRVEEDSSEFLSYIASVRYDNADPIAARKWVRENITSSSKTIINGVQFEIFANAPAVRMIRITPSP
jgi:hypothetical protein